MTTDFSQAHYASYRDDQPMDRKMLNIKVSYDGRSDYYLIWDEDVADFEYFITTKRGPGLELSEDGEELESFKEYCENHAIVVTQV